MDYIADSSLLILHRDTKLRQFLIKLTHKKIEEDKGEGEDEILKAMKGGGQDDEESDDDEEQGYWLDNSKIDDLCVNFGVAPYVTEEKWKEAQQKQKMEDINNLDKDKTESLMDPTGDNNSGELLPGDEEGGATKQTSQEEDEQYYTAFNKAFVKQQFEDVIKSNGDVVEFDKILETELRKKMFNISNEKKSKGNRSYTKLRKRLEIDHDELKRVMDEYKKKLFIKQKYLEYKSNAQD